MRRMRFSRIAMLALAIVAMGPWVVSCSKEGSPKLLLPPHGDQVAPSGAYSIAWTGVEISGGGRIVVPGELDLALGPDQVKDLAHSIFNFKTIGHHGWGVSTMTDGNGNPWLVLDPHPHNAAKLLLAYDPATGRAEGYSPVALPAPSAALNTLMKEFLVRTTGIQNPQDVTALKLEIVEVGHALHWNPSAKKFEPADIAYPALMVDGVTVEGVFYVGETQGSFSATIDRMVGDVTGEQVADCPECAIGTGPPGHHQPLGTNP